MKKGITAIIGFLLMILAVSVWSGSVSVKAGTGGLPDGENHKFDVINPDGGGTITVSGTPGTQLTEQTVRIRLNGATTKQPLAKGTDVTSWVACVNSKLSQGLHAKVAKNADTGSPWIDVTFYGITQYGNWDDFYFRIPYYYLIDDGSTVDWHDVQPDKTGKFNIVREGSSSATQVSFSPESLTVSGNVNQGISSKELTVTINGVFRSNLSAGKDVTEWFKGKGTRVTENGTLYSFLPKGMKVTVKKAVTGFSGNSVTLVFSGTPKEASIDSISFTFPAGCAIIADDNKKCETDAEFTTPIYVNNKYKYQIQGPNGYYRQGVALELGDEHLIALRDIDANHPVIVKATVFGTDTEGNPITLRDSGYESYNNRPLSQVTWNSTDGGLSSYGLTGTIRNWVYGANTFDIELTGTVKENTFDGKYPHPVYISFDLKADCNTSGNNIKSQEVGEMWIDEPVLAVHTEDDPDDVISCEISEAERVSFLSTIYLDDTTLAKEIPARTRLKVNVTKNSGYEFLETSYKGITIITTQKANVGDHEIQVSVEGTPDSTGNGYIPIYFEKEYLERYKSAKKLT
ncbi:MAG: hypothetical protein K6G81_09265, partial [Lachnospiraceae bacterium]|nr:hypothetical protein [Lachnospiraceae bacterium]